MIAVAWPALGVLGFLLPIPAFLSYSFNAATPIVWPSALAFCVTAWAAATGHALIAWAGGAWLAGYVLASWWQSWYRQRLESRLRNDESFFVSTYLGKRLTVVLKSGQKFSAPLTENDINRMQERLGVAVEGRATADIGQPDASTYASLGSSRRMTMDEVTKVVQDYGTALEDYSTYHYGISESLLPYPREQIEEALRLASSEATDPKVIEQLAVGYLFLANFLPDPDGSIAMNLREPPEVSELALAALRGDEEAKKAYAKLYSEGKLHGYNPTSEEKARLLSLVTDRMNAQSRRLELMRAHGLWPVAANRRY
jgi:hypothetical protein